MDVTNSKTVYGVSVAFLGLGAAALALLALLTMMACGGSAEKPGPSPTPPSGMFSTLPTSEPPVVGDQPPTIELNTPVPTPTSQPTPTPNPTYTPVPTPMPLPTPNPTATPDPTATPTPNPTATPLPTPNPTATAYPTAYPTATVYPTATAYPYPTATVYPTATAYPTAYPTATAYPAGAGGGTPQPRGIPGGYVAADANIVILADTSGSMEGLKIDRLRKAILDFISRVEDPAEYIALVQFYDRIKVKIELEAFGKTEQHWNNEVKDLRHGGGTALYDAVAHAVAMLEDIGSQERANMIIALTDGEDTHSRRSIGDAVSRIKSASVDITFIGLAYGKGTVYYDLQALKNLAAAGNEHSRALEATPENISETFRSLTKWFQD